MQNNISHPLEDLKRFISIDDASERNVAISDSIAENTFEDRAFGSIIGAFVGDSCGSYHEFAPKLISEKEMDDCM